MLYCGPGAYMEPVVAIRFMATSLTCLRMKMRVESGLLPRETARKILISYYLCGRRTYIRTFSLHISLYAPCSRNGGEHDDVGGSRNLTRRGKYDITNRSHLRCVYMYVSLDLTLWPHSAAVPNTTWCKVCITSFARSTTDRKSERAGAIDSRESSSSVAHVKHEE